MKNESICELGDGLLMRHARLEDEEALVKFNRTMHGENEWDERGLEDWTRDLVAGISPLFDVRDIIVVEDTETSEIVSSLCLMSQTWLYEGVPFKVGRPELVATHPDYRRRGLVRKQFDEIHRWSATRGELVQAITGIPEYYRQFGYEMAMNLSGEHLGFEPNLPKLKDGESEPYTFRPASAADFPFIQALYQRGCQRNAVSTQWDAALWAYEQNKRPYNIAARQLFIIQTVAGEDCGFIAISPLLWSNAIAITAFELKEGVSWLAATPSVVRFAWQLGEKQAEVQKTSLKAFGFWLGEQHPVYDVYDEFLPRRRAPYAWYLRVPDMATFIQTIAPALEKRLAGSVCAGHTGTLKISFYRSGVLLQFDQGKLTEVKPLAATELEKAQASFPGLTFIQMLFGWRNFDEIKAIFPDCEASSEGKVLIKCLFPRKPSNLWPIS